jgi:hypothetical protein
LRLNALITAYPRTEMTIDGPKTAISIIDTINKVSAHCTGQLLDALTVNARLPDHTHM